MSSAPLFLTATEYHARVLREQGQRAVAFRALCEQKLQQQGIAILSPFAEESLWFEVVRDVPLANKKAFVAACQEAFKTLLLYQIPFSRLRTFEAENVKLFYAVLNRFLQQKKQLTFLEGLSQLDFRAESLTLFGFVDLPPLYQQILPLFDGEGAAQQSEKISAQIQQANSPEEEFLGALKAIENQWQRQPFDTFVLVVQQATLPWKTIHRLLKTHQSPLKISCSKGEVWVDQPKFYFIKDLFASLTSTDILLFSRVLTSPFWQEDFARRLVLDQSLRRNMLRVTSAGQVLKHLLYADPGIQETRWFQAWQKLSTFNPVEGQDFIENFLRAAEFVTLPTDNVANVNLHIVSSLEAAALPVDAVWLLSADSNHYPLEHSTPLLLPKALLAEHGVPLGVEARYDYGKKILSALTTGKKVYASYVASARGEKNQLSPFLEGLGEIRFFDASHKLLNINRILPSEGNDDRVPIPLIQTGILALKGGSTLLKEQAECPFKAFAHFRLNVSALEMGQALLEPMQKGQMVHSVLEKIWGSLKSQERLCALSQSERLELITQKVEETLWHVNVPARRSLIRQLEKSRLIRVLQAWLELEMQRPLFHVVACEAKSMIVIEGLQFNLRIDRIDEVEQGKLVIDYKNGEISSRAWFEERLRDPQLPLYVLGNQAVGAVFASLKVGKMDFVGVVKDAAAEFQHVKKATHKAWDIQCQDWHNQLNILATEFRAGHLAVAPIDDKACLYCDLSAFCRIKARSSKIL